jgi:predicted naringenin-chalcone synthase
MRHLFDAAIGARGDHPFEGKIVVGEALFGDDIATAVVYGKVGQWKPSQPEVDLHPSRRRQEAQPNYGALTTR